MKTSNKSLFGVVGLLVALCFTAAAAGADASAWRVYVTNEKSGTLSVIEGPANQVVATVTLGKRPRGLKISPDGKQLFVALSGSPAAGPGVDESKLPPADKSADGIGVFDAVTLTRIRVIKGVSDPEQLALSHDGKQLFVASEDTGQLVVLDVASGKRLAALKVGGEPEGISVTPDGRYVYVTSEADHQISVVEVATRKVVARVVVGARPRFTSFSADGSRAYVSCEDVGTLYVLDARKFVVLDQIKLEGALMRPVGSVVSADGTRLYVATGRGKQVMAIDLTTDKVVGQVEAGSRPWGIDISPDGRTLYTANGSSNDVSVIDVATHKVVARVQVGESPWGVVVGVKP